MDKKKFSGVSIKTFLPRTLFARSLLILIIPVLLIQVITAFIFFDRHWSKITTRLSYAVAGEIALISKVIERDSSQGFVDDVMIGADEKLGLKFVYKEDAFLHDVTLDLPSRGWESMVAGILTGELRNIVGKPFALDIDFKEKRVQIWVQLEDGVLYVSLPQRRLFSSSGYIFLLWMMGTSLALLVIAILFMRNQIRPIKKLAIAAERFGRGHDVVSFKPQGATEVRMAAQAFLDMHRRIRRQIEQRTTMLAGVSHDLRTPLTRLKLQMAMLEDSAEVDAMKFDIQDMEKMIDGYLDFVRGEGDEKVSLTSLNVILEKVVASAKRQGINITVSTEDKINITVRPVAFERCLANLINNAGKYAHNVWVSFDVDEKNRLILLVEDDGSGIPEDQYEEVFRPFYRVDVSRNVETGGIGLGLPIAMDVVHGHGGEIWLDRSEYGGLKVTIRLPL